jgi:fatty acid desaturase
VWRRPTNTLAILALVMAFAFPPAGLVLGIIARKQIRETGEEGDGLALAGIIIGAIALAFIALAVAVPFVLLAGVGFSP